MKAPRRSTPRELLAAYRAASGYPGYSNRQIDEWLQQLCAAGFHPEDVKAVCDGIQWHQRNGTRGYTSASIYIKNAMDPMNFIDRATKARKQKAAREKCELAKARSAGSGPAPEEMALPHDPNLQAKISALKRSLLGGGGV